MVCFSRYVSWIFSSDRSSFFCSVLSNNGLFLILGVKSWRSITTDKFDKAAGIYVFGWFTSNSQFDFDIAPQTKRLPYGSLFSFVCYVASNSVMSEFGEFVEYLEFYLFTTKNQSIFFNAYCSISDFCYLIWA